MPNTSLVVCPLSIHQRLTCCSNRSVAELVTELVAELIAELIEELVVAFMAELVFKINVLGFN